MPNKYTLSKSTKQDIISITKHSLKDFGEGQTLEYMNGLQKAIHQLAQSPNKGRKFVNTRTKRSYFSYRYVSHVIYYRKRNHDIFITRILHSMMLPEKHF